MVLTRSDQAHYRKLKQRMNEIHQRKKEKELFYERNKLKRCPTEVVVPIDKSSVADWSAEQELRPAAAPPLCPADGAAPSTKESSSASSSQDLRQFLQANRTQRGDDATATESKMLNNCDDLRDCINTGILRASSACSTSAVPGKTFPRRLLNEEQDQGFISEEVVTLIKSIRNKSELADDVSNKDNSDTESCSSSSSSSSDTSESSACQVEADNNSGSLQDKSVTDMALEQRVNQGERKNPVTSSGGNSNDDAITTTSSSSSGSDSEDSSTDTDSSDTDALDDKPVTLLELSKGTEGVTECPVSMHEVVTTSQEKTSIDNTDIDGTLGSTILKVLEAVPLDDGLFCDRNLDTILHTLATAITEKDSSANHSDEEESKATPSCTQSVACEALPQQLPSAQTMIGVLDTSGNIQPVPTIELQSIPVQLVKPLEMSAAVTPQAAAANASEVDLSSQQAATFPPSCNECLPAQSLVSENVDKSVPIIVSGAGSSNATVSGDTNTSVAIASTTSSHELPVTSSPAATPTVATLTTTETVLDVAIARCINASNQSPLHSCSDTASNSTGLSVYPRSSSSNCSLDTSLVSSPERTKQVEAEAHMRALASLRKYELMFTSRKYVYI